MSVALAPRVNLMPRAESERRAKALLMRRWSIAIVAALAIVVVASGAAFALQVTAAGRLAYENARTVSLLGQVGALSDVRSALELETELEAFRAQAMATDVEWTPLLERLEPALPAGTLIVGFRLAPGGMLQGEDPEAEVGVLGELTVVSMSTAEVAPILRAIRPMSGVMGVEGWSTQRDDTSGVYSHIIQFQIDQTVYTGDYAEEGDQ